MDRRCVNIDEDVQYDNSGKVMGAIVHKPPNAQPHHQVAIDPVATARQEGHYICYYKVDGIWRKFDDSAPITVENPLDQHNQYGDEVWGPNKREPHRIMMLLFDRDA